MYLNPESEIPHKIMSAAKTLANMVNDGRVCVPSLKRCRRGNCLSVTRLLNLVFSMTLLTHCTK